MIERLRLQNYEAHADLKLRIDPAITCIIGTSDLGKSSILRALQWGMRNCPAGDAMIRHNEKNAFVSVWVDGKKVKRSRGSKGNRYALDDDEFSAFGNGVPRPIDDLCNVSDANFQYQLGAPFWMDLTGGELSKELNKIVDLRIMDDVVQRVKGEAHEAKVEVNIHQRTVEGLNGKIPALEWTESALSELRELREIRKQIEDESLRHTELIAQKNSLRILERDVRCMRQVVKGFQPICRHRDDTVDTWKKHTQVTRDIKLVQQLRTHIVDLPTLDTESEMLAEWERLEKKASTLQEIIDSYDAALGNVFAAPIFATAKQMSSLWDMAAKMEENRKLLETQIDELNRLEAEQVDRAAQISELRERMETESPEVCEVCGQEITK